MFTRKLNALQYEQPFNIENDTDFQKLIFWLENTKIRFYAPNDRDNLEVGAVNWSTGLENYLKEIGFQGAATGDRKKVVDFLLNLALQYQMEDTRSQMNLSKAEISDLAKVNTSAANLTRIDVNSAPFIDGLRELSALLDVPFYQEEPLITLRAIAILLRRLKKDTLSHSPSETSSNDGSKKKKLSFKTDDSKLAEPFSKTSKYDASMNRAANVLRLLYVNDLRQLQTAINGMIVQVQSLTANPKTDTKLGKLGKVGR